MLNPGQPVMIRKDLVPDSFYGGSRFHYGMSYYRGKKGTVIGPRHYDSTKFLLSIEHEGYDWTEEMLIKL